MIIILFQKQEGGMDFDHLDGTVLGVCKDNQMAQYISSNGKIPENRSDGIFVVY